jgi:uncharacterized DUF497 family protein
MQTPAAFEWNDDNEARHLAKHGLVFDFAIGIFLDDNRLEEQDTRNKYDPPRYNTVGVVDGICINVTFAMVGDTAVIISARCASRKERKRYGS